MIGLFTLKIDFLIKETIILEAYKLLSAERIEFLKKYVHKEDLLRGLYSSILSRALISRYLKIPNSKIIFDFNKYSKPFLAGFENFHFNTAHSGDYAVCAVSDTPVGIDIEEIKPIDLNVAEYAFSEFEYKELIKKKNEDQLDYFYNIWVLKESYIKAIGTGLYTELKSFYFELSDNNVKIHNSNNDNFLHFRIYDCFSGYKCSICSENIISCINPEILNFSCLINELKN
ncbi:4'-phosphopantetheinyl transferase superfamily protein [Candidatus Dependentiae bacterium]|nr:4'-phosphopantetheinyl transferase superfamily protein [Candidatus Dependentiae bacterium]